MQYFKPSDPFFVGDCMPFFHQGEFRLYYLLDENHHQSLGGLGGHQWAHASSTDLVNWDHHPLAIPITHDWEGSICTGSVFHHQGTYYGYYATRMPDRKQHLSLATSTDGIKFEKVQPNPLASPIQGYDPHHYRDPVVFCDGGVFHMLVTAKLTNYPVEDRGGCLAHLMSNDLQNWEVVDPFFVPGELTVPECPDYFEWSGWYYLIFSTFGVAHYRVSKNPFG
ncbi:TPA: glycosyl hydrolase, partial [Candidatus Poribacteria bacterium]|nr:glycosyl hydrolase [Candidatus Poribacteria bacterium]